MSERTTWLHALAEKYHGDFEVNFSDVSVWFHVGDNRVNEFLADVKRRDKTISVRSRTLEDSREHIRLSLG